MDSHSFSEPRLLEKSDPLTWQVEVLRRGQIVDILQVNATNFPPRFNKKKKVVWQLPVTEDQLPRFGEYEKERLWEMFKQQKKERRKKVKPPNSNNNFVDDTTESRGQSFRDDDVSDSNYNEGSSIHNEDDRDKPQQIDETPNMSQRHNGSLHPAPPPGFSLEDVSSPRKNSNKSDPVSSDSRGISMSSGDRNALTVQLDGPPAQVSLSSTSSTSTESPLQPCPRHSPNNHLDANFIAQVAKTFIQSLTTKEQIDQWLSIYLERAPSTLMVGQAQAVCSTSEERSQQWKALQQPFWECQGWTLQECGAGGGLLVLTGRTMQPTGTFYYNLTLILTPQYQIQNSILSFSLLLG